MSTFRSATIILTTLALAGLAPVAPMAFAQTAPSRDAGTRIAKSTLSNTRVDQLKLADETLPTKAAPIVTRDNEGDGSPVA
ncbi:MAG: hypothetical protein ACK462_11885, partial [Planctomyces sp.]